jgi:hypothetical protein
LGILSYSPVSFQNTKSHVSKKILSEHVAQKTICALLLFSLAFFRFLLPNCTFSRENSLSATNWEMLSAWISMLAESSVWSEEISRREDSAVL